MNQISEWTMSKIARRADINANVALHWADRGNLNIALVFMLYALVLAVLSITEQMVKQDR